MNWMAMERRLLYLPQKDHFSAITREQRPNFSVIPRDSAVS
jgi:hypothetical protein